MAPPHQVRRHKPSGESAHAVTKFWLPPSLETSPGHPPDPTEQTGWPVPGRPSRPARSSPRRCSRSLRLSWLPGTPLSLHLCHVLGGPYSVLILAFELICVDPV